MSAAASEATTVLLKKRERTQNWIPEEKSALFALIKHHVNAIENKKIDAAASAIKSLAWQKIYFAFRGRFSADRDITRIREQWRRMKAQARMEMYTYAEKVRPSRVKKKRKEKESVKFSSSFSSSSSRFFSRRRSCAGANSGTGSGHQVPSVESVDRGVAADGERAQERLRDRRSFGRQ